jgi:hypothetical protein
MRAAGPGSIDTSTRSITGREPGTSAMTLTGSVPVAPALTRPDGSTPPSNQPPAWRKLTVAFGTARPSASRASACRRSVSPAATERLAGVTTIRAIGD